MKASEIAFNSPDHKWIVEMTEELQSLWRVSEEAIGVNRANYKSPTFIATLLPDLVKDSFGGFTFKLLREQWMKANLALANGERKDFQTLEWTMVRDAIRTAPLAVDESRLLAKPLTEAEQEAAALKAFHDGIESELRAGNPEPYLKHHIGQLAKDWHGENPAAKMIHGYMDLRLAKYSKTIFDSMLGEIVNQERSDLVEDVEDSFKSYLATMHLIGGKAVEDKTVSEILKYIKGNRPTNVFEEIEAKAKMIGKKAICKTYFNGQRKYFSPNVVIDVQPEEL